MLDLNTFVVIVVALLMTVYLFLYKKFHHWTSLGVKSEDTNVLSFGRLIKSLRKPLDELEMEYYRKYGRFYGEYEGLTPILVVGDPELIKLILIKDFNVFSQRRIFKFKSSTMNKMLSVLEGEDWKRVRSATSPTFSSGKMKRMASLVMECAERLSMNLKKKVDADEKVDLRSFFGNFTLDTIASCAFGTKVDPYEDPTNPFIVNAQKLINQNFKFFMLIFIFFPFLMRFMSNKMLGFGELDFFQDASVSIRKRREKEQKEYNDFLQLMMDATKEVSESRDDFEEHVLHAPGDTNWRKETIRALKKRTLDEEEALAQCVLFFVAGFETVSNLLTFASYYLAVYPDVQEKLQKEIDEMFEKEGQLNFEAINTMKYLDAVMSETLRILPPAPRLERKANEDYVLGETGIKIPKGTVVQIPVYGMHHDPEFFPEPEVFNPDRFLPENVASIIPYTYLPFGAGPRNCIGMRFALMEAKYALAYLVRQVQFLRCPETQVPLKFKALEAFRPSDLVIKVQRR